MTEALADLSRMISEQLFVRAMMFTAVEHLMIEGQLEPPEQASNRRASRAFVSRTFDGYAAEALRRGTAVNYVNYAIIDDPEAPHRRRPELDAEQLRAMAEQLQQRTDEWLSLEGFGAPRLDTLVGERETTQARERARGLLKRLLTTEQWTEFEKMGRVTEWIGNRKFVLIPGEMIEVRGACGIDEIWCAQIGGIEKYLLPTEDSLIAQLLHLRADPDELRDVANVYTVAEDRPLRVSLARAVLADIADRRGYW